MIEYFTGDMFKLNVEALVNTVNLKGVMGAGIAKQCKELYPENFRAYKKWCDGKDIALHGYPDIGRLFIFWEKNKYIVNFPTKRDWRYPSIQNYILEGLDVLNEAIDAYRWKSIVIPPLGCGLGGLDYKDVKFFITAKLKKHIESKFTTLYLVDDK